MKIKKFFFIGCVLTLLICNPALKAVSIVYSDMDYGCGWENYASEVTIQNAYEVGVNLAVYAANNSGSVRIMQVIHGGDYDPDPGSLKNLVKEVNARTKVNAIDGGLAKLGQTDLSNVDMLYVTGHNGFILSPAEKAALKSYLDKGGLLLADDCSNYQDNQGFEIGFRNVVSELYGVSLEKLPANHGIYSAFYTLDGNDFSYTAKGNGTEWNQEPLEGYMVKSIPAAVDFDPDTLNLRSEGKFVTVYIESSEDLDVKKIDIPTIRLNETVNAELAPTEIGDHDKDGKPDLMVKFKRSPLHIEVGEETKITITGKLTDGTPFKGSDTIRVINKGKKKK